MALSYFSHNGNGNRSHNIRTMAHQEKDRIDLSKKLEPFKDIDCRDFYNDFFKADLEEYNSKQKRKDRKIADYYDYVDNNKNFAIKDKRSKYYGQGQPFREMLITLGSMESRNTEEFKQSRDKFFNMCKYITDNFEKWYPNLKVIGSYPHEDEPGCYHLHLDYVPVAFNQKRGLKTQYSFTKALEQMGFKTEGETVTEQRENYAAKKFSEDWNSRLLELFKQFDIEIKGYDHNRKAEHLSTQDYKRQKELEEKAIRAIANEKILNFPKPKALKAQAYIEIQQQKEQIKIDNNRVLRLEFKNLHKQELAIKEQLLVENKKLKEQNEEQRNINKSLVDTQKTYLKELDSLKAEISSKEGRLLTTQAKLKAVEHTLSTEQTRYINSRISLKTERLEKENEDLKAELNEQKSYVKHLLTFIGRVAKRAFEFFKFSKKSRGWLNLMDKYIEQDQRQELNNLLKEEERKDKESQIYLEGIKEQLKRKEEPSKDKGGRGL